MGKVSVQSLGKEVKSTLKEAVFTTWTLLKIMIPISIIVKVLKETGAIDYIGGVLSPVMEIVGIPGDYGLVWATAMVTNIYGGMVVFFSISLVMTPPRVSIPKESGVTSRSKTSLTSPFKTPP